MKFKTVRSLVALIVMLAMLAVLFSGCGSHRPDLPTGSPDPTDPTGSPDPTDPTRSPDPTDPAPRPTDPTEPAAGPSIPTEPPATDPSVPEQDDQMYLSLYSYAYGGLISSEIHTFQYITGAECWMSAWEWDMEDTVSGYDEDFSIYLYEYSGNEVNQYIEYLGTIGFEFYCTLDYENGVDYFYYDEANNYVADIFVYNDGVNVGIEITHARNLPSLNDREVTYYNVYSYTHRDMLSTSIYTYQYVTGAECWLSAWDWDMEDYVYGYDENYSIFYYAYDSEQLTTYWDYLESIGFVYTGYQDYTDGTSYFYEDYANEYHVDCFVTDDGDVAIEITHGGSSFGYGEVSYYNAYSYQYGYLMSTSVYTYQYVTGAECWLSAWEWNLEDTVYGYDDEYSIFFYEYDYDQVVTYWSYLESIGFDYWGSEEFTDGTSFYYYNFTYDYFVDTYVDGDGNVAIELTHANPNM